MRLRRLSLLVLALGCGRLQALDDAGIDGSPDVSIEDASVEDAGQLDSTADASLSDGASDVLEAAQNDVSSEASSDAVADMSIDVSDGGVTTTALVVNQS